VLELNRIVTIEYAIEVIQSDGEIQITPCSLKVAEEEVLRLSAIPLIGEPLKVRILSRTKVTVINATTWEPHTN